MAYEQGALYGITVKLLATHGAVFQKVEPHEAGDPDGGDLLWLSVEDSAMSDGELISLSPLSGDRWYADHDLAHKYGGWPTVWSFAGTESEVLATVGAYLSERR